MCNTCELIEKLKNDSIKNNNTYRLYAIIRRIQYKDKMMNGTVMSGLNPLIFCPECGKRLGDD